MIEIKICEYGTVPETTDWTPFAIDWISWRVAYWRITTLPAG